MRIPSITRVLKDTGERVRVFCHSVQLAWVPAVENRVSRHHYPGSPPWHGAGEFSISVGSRYNASHPLL